MSSFARPLNTPSRTNTKANDKDVTPTQASKHAASSNLSTGLPTSDISSPHELTAFVETLLEQLDAKFDDMSTQILDRMSQMSVRVDSLEAAIQDIINNGDVATTSLPPSPIPASESSNSLKRRS